VAAKEEGMKKMTTITVNAKSLEEELEIWKRLAASWERCGYTAAAKDAMRRARAVQRRIRAVQS
jgi:hypothetical protein